MRNRFRSLLLFSARLVVGYPAAWLLAVSSSPLLADVLDTAICRCQSLFHRLVRVPVRQGAAHLAPRDDTELILFGLAVTVLAFVLALWLLPVQL
jgi:hypothetical protein